jgi:4-amino-4-deoxy-L-arabinose transferase-like glycosyltransferase
MENDRLKHRDWNLGRIYSPDVFSRRIEWAVLAALLILAAGLRMGWPGLTEFKADEARLMTLALDMVEGQRFPIRGIGSSVGFPNAPMSVWLYALPLAAWRHVYSATLFTGLLNTLAVLGCWWFVRRYWGSTAALAAALMYAVSPWAVLYSRKIWAQNLLPLFVVGWAISAGLTFVERRPRFILLHLLCLAVAVQLHLSAIALIVATAVFLLLFWRRVHWRWTLLGVGAAALTALPFGYYLASTGLGPGAALDAVQNLEDSMDLTSLRHTWLISLGREIHSLAGPSAFRDYLTTVPDISLVHWLWGALILGGLGWLAWRAWRWRGDRAAEAGLLVVVWALLPPLFFVYHSTPVFTHYFITTYPAQYIAAGVVFSLLARRLRGAGWVILTASAAAQVWIWLALLAFVGSQATPVAFGTPLAMQVQATDRARMMLVEESAAEILIAGSGEFSEFDQFTTVNSVLLRSVPHRLVDVSRSAVFPVAPAIVLLDHSPGEMAAHYLAQARRAASVPLRAGDGALQVMALSGGAAPAPDFEFESPYLLANGVTLFGYESPVRNDDGTATWLIYWRSGTTSETDYHFFNHLMDGQGQRVGQADAAAFSARQWQAGDTIISRFVLPWPADAEGPLTMRTGMYTYPAIENIPVLDVAGNPYTDAVEIALP